MNKKDLWIAYCDELADKLSNALGIDRDNMFDYKESALSMAETGDSNAQLFFGFLSLFDPGRDVAKANHWLKAASDQNNIDAITTIGIMNYCGSSSPDSDARLCCTSRKADEITPAPDAAMPWHPRAPCSGARVA